MGRSVCIATSRDLHGADTSIDDRVKSASTMSIQPYSVVEQVEQSSQLGM